MKSRSFKDYYKDICEIYLGKVSLQKKNSRKSDIAMSLFLLLFFT